MEITINSDNKWRIDIHKDGKQLYMLAIPPKDTGERIDFIDRRWRYRYGYTGAISHGILIKIKGGRPTLQYIPEHTLTRLKNIL